MTKIKCPDTDCSHRFTADEAQTDYNTDITVDDFSIDDDAAATANVSITIDVSLFCPKCGEQVAETSGECGGVDIEFGQLEID